MNIDGIIPKPFALLAVLGTLCLSGACATQSALAETLVERYSHEWDRLVRGSNRRRQMLE